MTDPLQPKTPAFTPFDTSSLHPSDRQSFDEYRASAKLLTDDELRMLIDRMLSRGANLAAALTMVEEDERRRSLTEPQRQEEQDLRMALRPDLRGDEA